MADIARSVQLLCVLWNGVNSGTNRSVCIAYCRDQIPHRNLRLESYSLIELGLPSTHQLGCIRRLWNLTIPDVRSQSLKLLQLYFLASYSPLLLHAKGLTQFYQYRDISLICLWFCILS